MKQYATVEDYIEILAGYEPGTNNWAIAPSNPNISLARYDVKIVESMAFATNFQQAALTDRQAALAVNLILKYRRQFAAIDIDVSPIENPVYRRPVRTIDRQKSIWIENDKILVRFPYNEILIKNLKQINVDGQGSAKFNNDNKTWIIGITEYTVNYLVTMGQSHGFTIDPELLRMFEIVLECEVIPYEIKLVKTENGYTVLNAAESMVEYINTHLGNDLIRLIDGAGVLGYTVDKDLLKETDLGKDTILAKIALEHELHIEQEENTLSDILDYAELTNRYPVCIWNPNIMAMDDISRFKPDEVLIFDQNGKTTTSNYDPHNVKLVYARKIPDSWTFPIPLLVSTQQMMYGGRKLNWLNLAEKIIYMSKTNLRR
jgi:hypothetical protein